MLRFPRSTFSLATAAMAASLLLVPSTAWAQDGGWAEPPTPYPATVLVGGGYVWYAAVWQPAPVPQTTYTDEKGVEGQVPDGWNAGAVPLTGSFNFGDGTQPVTFDSDEPTDGAWVWCDNSAYHDDGGTLVPGEDFGYNCRVEADHTYASQGLKTITLTVGQGTETAQSTSTQMVVDLAAGGSLTVKGTLKARSGGMYDQDFPTGDPGENTTAYVSVSAKRRSGTAATYADVSVSVPGMHPTIGTGMTFRGKAALELLYLDKSRTRSEAILSRVEGKVTNSAGGAGGGYASVHVVTERGKQTLVRVQIWNTSAGFTYVDTGYVSDDFWSLTAGQDVLLTGSAKIG